ncbi:TPA: NUDIX domain-containing protein [Candidatus Bipolaricaulota bacterium]|nr:NUDIX domain-containing protein [Candidatus Bipolaricaulota bacterium]HIP99074.1 NUDIX domain-containing protein [Candidatus Bipolaricaulota bacterium]
MSYELMARERAAGYILFRERSGRREYLIIRNRQGGHWGFPKGHIELGEDELAAARREVAEEVGIQRLVPVPGFRQLIRYRFFRKGELVEKQVTFFLGRAEEEGQPAPGEVGEMQWLPFPAALERITHEEQRELLRQAEALLARAG